MPEAKQLAKAVPPDVAAAVGGAVDSGDSASTVEIDRTALRERTSADAAKRRETVAALRDDIGAGLADVAAGRTKNFDTANIVERGRMLLANRSSSV